MLEFSGDTIIILESGSAWASLLDLHRVGAAMLIVRVAIRARLRWPSRCNSGQTNSAEPWRESGVLVAINTMYRSFSSKCLRLLNMELNVSSNIAQHITYVDHSERNNYFGRIKYGRNIGSERVHLRTYSWTPVIRNYGTFSQHRLVVARTTISSNQFAWAKANKSMWKKHVKCEVCNNKQTNAKGIVTDWWSLFWGSADEHDVDVKLKSSRRADTPTRNVEHTVLLHVSTTVPAMGIKHEEFSLRK